MANARYDYERIYFIDNTYYPATIKIIINNQTGSRRIYQSFENNDLAQIMLREIQSLFRNNPEEACQFIDVEEAKVNGNKFWLTEEQDNFLLSRFLGTLIVQNEYDAKRLQKIFQVNAISGAQSQIHIFQRGNFSQDFSIERKSEAKTSNSVSPPSVPNYASSLSTASVSRASVQNSTSSLSTSLSTASVSRASVSVPELSAFGRSLMFYGVAFKCESPLYWKYELNGTVNPGSRTNTKRS